MREVISCQCHCEGQMRLCWLTDGGAGAGAGGWWGVYSRVYSSLTV